MIESERIEKVESFLNRVHDLCLIEARFNTQKLAKQMNVVPTISTVLTNKKITIPVNGRTGVKRWNTKQPDKQMARAVIEELNQYSENTMRKSRAKKRKRKPFTPREKRYIIEHRESGMMYKDIAKKLNRQTETVAAWYRNNQAKDLKKKVKITPPKKSEGNLCVIEKEPKKKVSLFWGMIKIER
jgi:hypothetical protein